ncbi:MAG: GH25 family lysozyme [Chitinophagaceae bacterium]
MKRIIHSLIWLTLLFLLSFVEINAQQCLSGGCTNFGTQYPSSGAPYTPPGSWQVLINPATGSAALMNAGNYTKFNVTAGTTYEWSYCEIYGGTSTSWDAQLTLFNEANLTTPLCFSTDVCGTNNNAPYLSWTATFTGTVRLLTTAFVSGPGGCQINSGSPYNKLAYRQFTSAGCTTPGTPVNLSGIATGQTTANLSWSAGTPSGSPTITYYWVVGTSSSVTYGNGVAQGNTTSTSASTSALSCNTTYYLRVYANTNCNNTNSGYGTSSSFTTSSCSSSGIYGVDISHYNGVVSWSTVYAAGKIFAFAKATEGVNTNDNTFITNMTSSNPNGVILGAYHLGRPDFSSNNTPTNEANHFLSIAGSYLGNGYLPAALDMEPAFIDAYIAQGNTYSQLAQWINSWCVLVQNVSGKWPVLYTTKCYAANLRPHYNGTINSNIKLWIATNNISTDPAGNPGTTSCGSWSSWPWIFHQFFAPTIAGNNPTTYADPGMDQDFFNGTISDLTGLIGGGGSCTDNFETNDNCTTSTNVFASPLGLGTSNYTLNANIGYAGDQDWYKINLAACGTLTITLSNLPFNYDMELYAPGATCTSTIIQGSYNTGTNNEQIVFVNTTSNPVTVYAKVYPFSSSTFTTATCYALNFQWASSTCCTAPTIQASNMTFSGIGSNSMITSWTNGNGARRIVKINTTNSFTSPANGTDPAANTTYSGTGEQIIYNGTGNSVAVTGLSANTNYCFRTYEANCNGSSSLYNTSTAFNNPACQTTIAACAAPTIQASISSFTAATNSITVNFIAGNGSRRVVKINSTNSFTPPGNGTDPVANTSYGGGEQVVYNGTGNSVTVNNLSSSTNYCFRIYESNCNGTSSFYNTSTGSNNPSCQSTTNPCTSPTVQASIISFTASTNSIQVNIGAGNGSRRIVKVNTTNSFTPPVNGTDPSANSVYSGPSEQVVYNGTGTNVTVTGLTSSTNYCFRVYEANCAGTLSVYNTTIATNNPSCQLTNSACTTPGTQANSISFAFVGPNSIQVSCLIGTGSRRIIKMNTISSFTAPANGTDPVANSNYSGSGEQVIYNGNANLVTVTGLSASTNYCFRVYEANCIGSSSIYLTTTATNNPGCQTTTTSCPTLVQPSNLSPGITVYPGPTVSTNPSFNWTTSSSTFYRFELRIDPFSATDIIAVGNCVTPPYTLTGINWQDGVSYRWTVTATDACNSGCVNASANYFFTYNASGCIVPVSQAIISNSTPSANQITLSLSPGSGSRRLVKINTVNSFTDPVNGTDPAANPIYSGAGEQVVLNGNITAGIISGLNPSTNYCFRVYEANCSGAQSIYQTNNTNTLCQATNVVTAIPNINGLEIFQVIPNPNQGRFIVKIKLTSLKEVSFTLSNMLGAKIAETQTYRWTGLNFKDFNLSYLPAGIYLLETFIGKEHFVHKIIIANH